MRVCVCVRVCVFVFVGGCKCVCMCGVYPKHIFVCVHICVRMRSFCSKQV